MIATHQPTFLPWPGFFIKALRADCLVLLDDVQFPRGSSWLSRNRLKNEQGQLWLTVPVHRKGRSLQKIREVELFNARNWRRKHLRSILQSYANAPYLDDYLPDLRDIYRAGHKRLVDLNVEIISYLCQALELRSSLLLQSELAVTGNATDLIVRICQQCRTHRYFTFPTSLKYLEQTKFEAAGIQIVTDSYYSPVYPQLWGDFLPNLSTLDMLLNCGPKSHSLLTGAGRIA